MNLRQKRIAPRDCPSNECCTSDSYCLGGSHCTMESVLMTKTIDTLVDDIYKILDEGVDNHDEGYFYYGIEHEKILRERLAPDRGEERSRSQCQPSLRLSSIGKPCVRQLWYGLHAPLHSEPLRPFTRLKFLYGDLVETMLLELVRRAGHLVTGEQDEIFINGIKGHRDCIIDGMLVDVKSASSYSFKKFTGGLQCEDDAFGYLTQLGSYLLGSREDELVTYKNEAAFLVIDKVTGHLCLDRHTFTEEDLNVLSDTVRARKRDCADERTVPERGFEAVAEGKSGNFKLGVNCSYCPFKTHCWEGLRTFVYSGGRPVFLTHVEQLPRVPEIT